MREKFSLVLQLDFNDLPVLFSCVLPQVTPKGTAFW